MHSFFSACKASSTAVKEQICLCQINCSPDKGSDHFLCRSSRAGRHLSLVAIFFAETVQSWNVTEVPSHVPIKMLGMTSVRLWRFFWACFVKWRHLPGWGQGGTRSRCHGPGCQILSRLHHVWHRLRCISRDCSKEFWSTVPCVMSATGFTRAVFLLWLLQETPVEVKLEEESETEPEAR